MSPYTVVLEAPSGHWEFPCRDNFEATYIADEARKGTYIDDVDSVVITVDCPVHGYGISDDGQCSACLDDWLASLEF